MFESQLLIATGTEYSIYSPWFPRQGDNARFTLESVAFDSRDKCRNGCGYLHEELRRCG